MIGGRQPGAVRPRAAAPWQRRGGRILGRRRRVRLRRPGPRFIGAVVALLVLLGGAFLWLRDSSLVAVQHVRVIVASGPDTTQIRRALVSAAHNMTTLDVKMGQLRTAVAPYPVVKSLQVSTQFPHGMRIRVIEQVPVAVVLAAGQRTAVSADGTLLHDVVAPSALPTISLPIPPGGAHVTGTTLNEVMLMAAAPYQLLSRISQVSDGSGHGLIAQVRGGPSIYFGGTGKLHYKWSSATAVLANSGSAGAVYIDVTDPNRPVAGGGSDTNSVPASASSTTSTAGG
jgi:cell division protein FtsQ